MTEPTPPKPQRLKRALIALLFILLGAATVPRWWCGRGADAWFEGDLAVQLPLARHVAATVTTGVGVKDFKTGFKRFDGEWAFGSYQMAALALGQMIEAHPETRAELLPAMEAALDGLLREETRAFDQDAWQEDALATLEGPNGHAAYLGYMNLPLTLHRKLVPESRFAEVNDRISAALERRLRASPTGLIETYPLETYPVDNIAGVASLDLYNQVVAKERLTPFLTGWYKQLFAKYVDAKSGYLIQAVESLSGDHVDLPRASGTALSAYYLTYAADTRHCEALIQALERRSGTLLGFGAVCEYPAGVKAGAGDIDSGPVVFGLSFSGTGFSMGPLRAVGHREGYTAIYRTLQLVGAPYEQGDRMQFVTGGPLGNAIMLAALTARRFR